MLDRQRAARDRVAGSVTEILVVDGDPPDSRGQRKTVCEGKVDFLYLLAGKTEEIRLAIGDPYTQKP